MRLLSGGGSALLTLPAPGVDLADKQAVNRALLRSGAWEPVNRAHGRAFGTVLPANTLLHAGSLIGKYDVGVEAEAQAEVSRP
jgi:hypothetical protein